MDYERIAIIIVGIAIVSGATLLVSGLLGQGGTQVQGLMISYSAGNATVTAAATMLPNGSFRLDNGRLLDAAKDKVSVVRVLTSSGNISTCSCQKCEACPAPASTCANATVVNKTKETPSCLNNSEKCGNDSSCCSGYCNTTSGTCRTRPSCYGAGGKCSASAVAANAIGCCNGFFCNATSGMCQERCRATGTVCDKDTSCCSGYCNTATKQCEGKNASFQCTSNYCSNGVVYSGCHWDSDLGRCACDQSACDSQQCSTDGVTCAANTACTANGKNCSSSGACCSKYCNASSMTCKPYPNCQANHCENGVMYRNCEFDFAYNTCSCGGESICSTQRCNQGGTACDAQTCPSSYCKDGALFANCTVGATGACSCSQTICKSQQCNADGWTCK